MSAATSPGTGLAYGLQRVCAAWGFARSSFYAMKSPVLIAGENRDHRQQLKRGISRVPLIGRFCMLSHCELPYHLG